MLVGKKVGTSLALMHIDYFDFTQNDDRINLVGFRAMLPKAEVRLKPHFSHFPFKTVRYGLKEHYIVTLNIEMNYNFYIKYFRYGDYVTYIKNMARTVHCACLCNGVGYY
jgi:hypothetical protein